MSGNVDTKTQKAKAMPKQGKASGHSQGSTLNEAHIGEIRTRATQFHWGRVFPVFLQVLRQPEGHALQPFRRVLLRDVCNEEEDVELAESQIEEGDDAEENAPGKGTDVRDLQSYSAPKPVLILHLNHCFFFELSVHSIRSSTVFRCSRASIAMTKSPTSAVTRDTVAAWTIAAKLKGSGVHAGSASAGCAELAKNTAAKAPPLRIFRVSNVRPMASEGRKTRCRTAKRLASRDAYDWNTLKRQRSSKGCPRKHVAVLPEIS